MRGEWTGDEIPLRKAPGYIESIIDHLRMGDIDEEGCGNIVTDLETVLHAIRSDLSARSALQEARGLLGEAADHMDEEGGNEEGVAVIRAFLARHSEETSR